jgi:hypothetical protein
MSHFSLSTLRESAVKTYRRFPLPLLSALAATVSAIYTIQVEPQGHELPLVLRLAMACYLAMLLTISVTLFTERFVAKPWMKGLIGTISIALVALYFLTLPSVMEAATGIRFALLALALHLLVAFAPFAMLREMNGLWQYNKTLFIRILIGGVYSGVLFAGLALAILAVDNLFEVRINEKIYPQLWFLIAGIFHTGFFLSGVPENIAALERATDYPKGLKIFTLYVLVPLITVYLVILYSYAAKILLTSNWPVGWVANLVLAFSLFGILSFLLVYPLRDDKANPWVKFYSRLFYFLLVPLIVLLYVSIFKRIDMYGITVERYLVVLLALWLSIIAAFFILTNGEQIRMIPLSLCVVVLLATFGPWGAFAVSQRSQLHELTALLERNHVTVNGKVDTTSTHDMKAEDYARIESIVGYIDDMHGYQNLQLLFAQDIDSVVAQQHVNARTAAINMLHIKRVETDGEDSFPNIYRINERAMLNSAGYDFVAKFSHSDFEPSGYTPIDFFVKTDTVQLQCFTTPGSFRLTCRDYAPLVFEISELSALLSIRKDYELMPDLMTISANDLKWKAKLVFSSLELSRAKGETKLISAEGVLLLRFIGKSDQAANSVAE